MKTYDLIKELLQRHDRFKDSDKLLIWGVWHDLGLTRQIGDQMMISFIDFMKAPMPESITRARRKVQEDFPELDASPEVKREREEKEKSKGNFIYQEELL